MVLWEALSRRSLKPQNSLFRSDGRIHGRGLCLSCRAASWGTSLFRGRLSRADRWHFLLPYSLYSRSWDREYVPSSFKLISINQLLSSFPSNRRKPISSGNSEVEQINIKTSLLLHCWTRPTSSSYSFRIRIILFLASSVPSIYNSSTQSITVSRKLLIS